MKYKVGDRVRIVDRRTQWMNSEGLMDEWLGKVMTIKKVCDWFYKMAEDKDDTRFHKDGGWHWHDDMITGLAETINIEIDPSDPKAAHAAVTAAIKAHEERKRDWTDAEIEQAKELSRELVVKLFDAGCSVTFYAYDSYVGVDVIFGKGDFPSRKFSGEDCYEAIPKEGDVFNADIGKCVCLCKLTNTPVPEFIRNKNKEEK